MRTRTTVRPRKSAATGKRTAGIAPGSPPLPPGITDLKITPSRLRDHVIRPAHIAAVQTDREFQHDAGPVADPLKRAPEPTAFAPKHLDVKRFGDALHAALKNDVVGYVMRLRQHGSTIYTLQWNWARTPGDGGTAWNPTRRMHIASVSKLITAIAMTKLLDDKKISYDAKIVDYLPTSWVAGPGVNKITFRNLMTHTSGFVTAHGETDYLTMKFLALLGVSDRIGHYDYENMNFGLCRILIAIINGYVKRDAVLPDNAWDLVTIIGYSQYVAIKVLAAAGVSDATLAHPAGGVLAYSFPGGDGWDSGDLLTVSGGAGWHMSANDLLKVMGTFRRQGTIMSPQKAQTLLDSGFGIDVIQDTPAGRLYNKNGLWQDGDGLLGRVEQSLAYFLPEDMELVVLANSPVGVPRKFFRSVVSDIYLAHLK